MPPKPNLLLPIHLEGSHLEGGGQLLRVALGLSALTKKPIHITNIRGKRPGGGGLKAQHLTCVQWLGQACSARLSGVGLKSKEITFIPSPNSPSSIDSLGGDIRITQNTPGSIDLVLQAVLPFLLFSGAAGPIRLRVSGGTNVSNSPSHEYVAEVLIPMLELIGIPRMEAQVHSRGWSQGSTRVGSATFTITPLTTTLPAFQLTNRGRIEHVKAIVIAPRDTERDFRDELEVMFERRAERLFGSIHANSNVDRQPGLDGEYDTEITFEDSRHEKRYYILLVATSTTGIKLGRDWLYDQAIRPGKTERIPGTMVKKVSDDLLAEIAHGGCVDEFMRDQLLAYQALAEGRSEVRGGLHTAPSEGLTIEPSLHAKTAMWVAERMVGVEFDDGGCVGLGFDPSRHKDGEDIEDLTKEIEALNVSAS
ncbi:RNA 3'-terminal phosphate cyclase [Setomelanomma holmii]|uniref:RNA 3'-terminal phosphate cyclase n=1 Tax=Setomelanomma holmii TaxID=210430 RepID=A0A9P4HAG1_9PLEO|nr:RNA 3'-terminal phosphate cyclase [Setomelanomma holmii]